MKDYDFDTVEKRRAFLHCQLWQYSPMGFVPRSHLLAASQTLATTYC